MSGSAHSDSAEYRKRKQYFQQLLTIYGRNSVYEALLEDGIEAVCLHLSTSNKPAPILDDIVAKAKALGADIREHDRLSLSRISKNSKQDQGVALDIRPKGFAELDAKTHFDASRAQEYIALDRITNPQNLGMIVRSVCASEIAGLIIPRRGCARLDALVIKASAGTLFRAPILRCEHVHEALADARAQGCDVVGLDLRAKSTLAELRSRDTRIFVLGNESEGLSDEVRALCNQRVRIPMANGVESLNVAITASLIALRHQL